MPLLGSVAIIQTLLHFFRLFQGLRRLSDDDDDDVDVVRTLIGDWLRSSLCRAVSGHR